MACQRQSTRAKVVFVLACLLLSASILSSYTRRIHFSGPPQTISNKYEAALYGLYESVNGALVRGASQINIAHVISVGVVVPADEDRKLNWTSSSLYNRPPPRA